MAWVDMVAVDAAGERRTKEPRTRLDNRVRQVKGALDTLCDEGLAEVQLLGGTRRYVNFTMMHESGRGDLATPRTYSVPESNEATIEFFLKGWIHVLQPSEIAAWLMFRELARQYPREHVENGVYIYGDMREAEYGLKRDAYEGHKMLRGLGLLKFAPSATRNPDGTWTIRFPSRYDPHRFSAIRRWPGGSGGAAHTQDDRRTACRICHHVTR
ncbi:MAG: hypothetical protein ACRDSL_21505 [Pseudonocardiaceae bacterium]